MGYSEPAKNVYSGDDDFFDDHKGHILMLLMSFS